MTASPTSAGSASKAKGKRERKWHASTMTRERPNKEQRRVLDEQFARNPLPDSEDKERIVRLTGMTHKRVRTWFQNKRARERAKSAQKQKEERAEEDRSPETLEAVGALSSFLPKARVCRLPTPAAPISRQTVYAAGPYGSYNPSIPYTDATGPNLEPEQNPYHLLHHQYQQPQQQQQQHQQLMQQQLQLQQQLQVQLHQQQHLQQQQQLQLQQQQQLQLQQQQQHQLQQHQQQQQKEPTQQQQLQQHQQQQAAEVTMYGQQGQEQSARFSSAMGTAPNSLSHPSLGAGLDRYRLSSPSFDPRWPPSSIGTTNSSRDSSFLPPLAFLQPGGPAPGEHGPSMEERQQEQEAQTIGST